MMFTLVLEFKDESEVIQVPESVAPILARPYGLVHVWENPNGSWTINAAHAKDPQQIPDDELFELRINPDCSFDPPARQRLGD